MGLFGQWLGSTEVPVWPMAGVERAILVGWKVKTHQLRGNSQVRFTKDAWDGLADGSITVTFRRWKRCQVIVGNQYRSAAGMLEVDSCDVIDESQVIDTDAVLAGRTSTTDVLEQLGPASNDTILYRIRFHVAGPDPRTQLALTTPSPEELADILNRLARLDARSSHGPWTQDVLQVIHDQPAVRAPDLAEGFGRETKPFKIDVRKLKGLGLTQSQRVGYNISPRGLAVLDALRDGRLR